MGSNPSKHAPGRDPLGRDGTSASFVRSLRFLLSLSLSHAAAERAAHMPIEYIAMDSTGWATVGAAQRLQAILARRKLKEEAAKAEVAAAAATAPTAALPTAAHDDSATLLQKAARVGPCKEFLLCINLQD